MCIRYVRINVLLLKYPLHDVAGITVTHCGMYSPEVLKSLFRTAEKPVSRHGRASFAVRKNVFYDMKNSKRLYARVLYKMQNTRVFAAGCVPTCEYAGIIEMSMDDFTANVSCLPCADIA